MPRIAFASLLVAAFWLCCSWHAPARAADSADKPLCALADELDEGGSAYLHVRSEGSMNLLVEGLRPHFVSPQTPDGARKTFAVAERVIKTLALDGIDEVGMSIAADGDLTRTKTYVRYGADSQSARAIVGAAPHDFALLDYAPADTMLFSCGDYSPDLAWSLFKKVALDVDGTSAVLKVTRGVESNIVEDALGLPFEDLLSLMGDEWGVIATFDTAARVPVPTSAGLPFDSAPTPYCAIAIRVDDGRLYEALSARLREEQSLDFVEAERFGVRRIWVNREESDRARFTPTLAFDGRYVLIATHASYMDRLLLTKIGAPSLRSTDAFKRLTRGAPTRGNGLTYIDPRLRDISLLPLRRLLFGVDGPAPGDEVGANMLVDGLSSIFAERSVVRVNQPSGILTVRSAVGGGDPNPRFDQVIEKLDRNGDVLVYVDTKDLLSNAVESLDGWFASRIEAGRPSGFQSTPELFEFLRGVLPLVDSLGATAVEGIGYSSVSKGDRATAKTFLYMPGGPRGFWNVHGRPAHEFEALTYAPPDALGFHTQDYDSALLMEILRQTVEQVTGQGGADAVDEFIEVAGSILGLSVGELINSHESETSIIVIPGSADTTSSLKVLPALLLRTKDATIYNAIAKSVKDEGVKVIEEKKDSLRTLTFLDVPFGSHVLRPCVAYDGQRVIAAIDEPTLNRLLATRRGGPNLSDDAYFQKLTEGMPRMGTALSFMRSGSPSGFGDVVRSLDDSESSATWKLMDVLESLSDIEGDMASVTVYRDDGILKVTSQPLKGVDHALRAGAGLSQSVGARSLIAPGIAAIAIPGVVKAQTNDWRVDIDMQAMADTIRTLVIRLADSLPSDETDD